MPRILITPDYVGRGNPFALGPVAEIVTLSEIDGIYTICCTGDGVDECPSNIESGDTWSNFEDCVQEAIRHIGDHEGRGVAPWRDALFGATLVLVNRAGQHREVALSIPHGGAAVVVETGEVLVLPGMKLTVFSESLTYQVRS